MIIVSLTFVLLTCFTLVLADTADDPITIVSRSEWGAKPNRSEVLPLRIRPAPFVVIHHADTPTCTARTDCDARVRSIQDYHMNKKLWSDIAYNFLVGEDGNVYEGRGWGQTGAHAKYYNSKSIGICIIGKYQGTIPNDAAVNAVQKLIDHGVSINEITSNYTLKSHRQVWRKTSCPGDKLNELIKTWPHWSA